MTIPPFPSQDLAKLVLGYLAEEQLMTAYDEFLQASPYLDAHRNEYDRIFMTSLRNILAEYWAVKIFVESCKPVILRKKLLQCNNLLDAVKYLVNHVDVAKLQLQDTSIEIASYKHNNTSYNQLPVTSRQSGCAACMSLSSTSCTCKDNHHNPTIAASQVENSTLMSSVDATPLEHLPGNVATRKNDYETEITRVDNISLAGSSHLSPSQRSGPGTDISNEQNVSNYNNFNIQTTGDIGMTYPTVKPTECIKKIEEFNNILYKVCETKTSIDSKQGNIAENIDSRISNCATINYAIAVSGTENQNVSALDYTTAKNAKFLKEATTSCRNTGIVTEVSKAINDVNTSSANFIEVLSEPKNINKIDNKIKIISDIKVESHCATSKPLMQTIRINGTPVYRQKPPPQNSYTTDEIMAMPTLILVPATGPPSTQNIVYQTHKKPIVSQAFNQEATKTVSSERILGPLVIDVSSNSTAIQPIMSIQQSGVETGLVRTIDLTKNSSVPKDNTIATVETNTPQVHPPVRKSSSTPRRNSHIRVLDFTAPRRILQETIQEQPSNTISSSLEFLTNKDSQLPITSTDNAAHNTIIDMSSVTVHKIECPSNFQVKATIGTDKKRNWDTDLRALLAASEIISQPAKKTTKKTSKKKTIEEKSQNKKEKETGVKKIRIKKSMTPKKKEKRKPKPTKKDDDDVKITEDTAKVIVKPTIKVITGDEVQASRENKTSDSSMIQESQKPDDSSSSSDSKKGNDRNTLTGNIPENESNMLQESKRGDDSNQHESNNDAVNETPEAERISLQNVIGAKLNISELLETPYKQALYDIQMETPKFLGPYISDEPISDIKIMNIPTPRFFDTPKPAQATPSSYSSRPTDYSSGGSYYKPDDQDYIPILEIDCPVSSKPDSATEPFNDKENESKKTRPVRKCAKNVSYSLNHNANNKLKEKETYENTDVTSTCSDLLSLDSSFEYKPKPKTPQRNKCKSQHKSETNKKKIVSGKPSGKSQIIYKSPVKKCSSFIKIKPRRPTPTKGTRGRSKKNLDSTQRPSNKTNKTSNKISNKEKNIKHTPIITCVPKKSRRKSSTPRKLHCTKSFNSESSGQDSPKINRINGKEETTIVEKIEPSHDSDTEQLHLHWSDSSQESKSKKTPASNESEDIVKIKEYIQTTVHTTCTYDPKGSFHNDLIIRGFDAETAKSIERDLLDTPPRSEQQCKVRVEIIQPQTTTDDSPLQKSVKTDSNCTKTLRIDPDVETEEEEIELSSYECDEESRNYMVASHDYTKETFKRLPTKLKEKFSMEVCIDDGVPIRLRATDFSMLFKQTPQSDTEIGYSYRETVQAVDSISTIDRLYTPLKDPTKAHCYEIFDSTLTSLDTPLKRTSQTENEDEITEIQIVIDEDCNADTRKRKRLQSNSPEHITSDTKKKKSEAQYLLNSTNIQNIDIESVLTKLHGP